MKAPSESLTQIAIMAYLRQMLPKSCQVFSTQNGLRTSKRQAAKAKAEGMMSGVPDIIIVRHGGSVAFLEVKKEGGYLSPTQREFRDWCGRYQVPFAVVRSVDDVRETLAEWNVQTREAA